MDETVYATFSMVMDDNAWLMLEEGLQPFAPLVQDRVLREMRRHSSFGDHRLRYKTEPFPVEGYRIITWEAVSV